MTEQPDFEHFKDHIGGLRIVVHDTDREWQRIMVNELRGLGFNDVRRAYTPQDALVTIREMKADVLITHWDMRLVRFIRRHAKSPKRDLPIILVTGQVGENRVLAARDQGIDEYVSKPASARQIYDHIVNAVRYHRPFIDSSRYAGPDRRRRARHHYRGPDRRRRRARENGAAA